MTDDRHSIRWGQLLYFLVSGLAFLWLLLALAMAFDANLGKPLNQDIPEFIEGALASTYFYDSGLREPFHVFCLKIALHFFPHHEQAARLTTVAQTLFAAFAMWYFAKTVFGHAVGLISLWLFVVNPVVIFYGVSGMRASIYMALLMLFAGKVWTVLSVDQARARDILWAGLIGGSLILTRRYGGAILVMSLLVGVCLVWRFKRERWMSFAKASGAIMAVAGLLFLPDLLFHETPAFKDNVNFFRNLELYGEIGGFRQSPPVSYLHYIFVDHTPFEVVSIVSKNIFFFPSDYLSFFFRHIPYFWCFAWLATFSIYRSPTFAWVSLFAWLSLAPIVFVLHLDQVAFGKGVENRLVIQTFAIFLPAMVAFLLLTIKSVLVRLLRSPRHQASILTWSQKLQIQYWDTF
jgi:hypothetical protein